MPADKIDKQAYDRIVARYRKRLALLGEGIQETAGWAARDLTSDTPSLSGHHLRSLRDDVDTALEKLAALEALSETRFLVEPVSPE